ncbi:NfeD family protein [Pilimelia columellifera]|uniref:NfeD-like C-terminal domain-containing protein n=1 Tax=Pilimelia columellifera subsp. columellifera TaxID=706583 RepID=A0ABP6ATP4_9ACTN
MDALVWVALGVVLAVAELFTVTLVLAMFSVGAFAAALASGLGANTPIQLGVFAAVSALGALAARPVIQRHRRRAAALPARFGVDAVEGSLGIVIEPVDDESGLIKVAGELWSARVPLGVAPIDVGSHVRVVSVSGATVMVREHAGEDKELSQ